MSIKVYIHFDCEGYPEKTSKLAIPKSWSSKTVYDVMGLFAKAYNDKNAENTIDIEHFHLEDESGDKIYSTEIVENALCDRGDYHMKPGAHVKQYSDMKAGEQDNRLRCRNYGCNKHYLEEENNDEACQHHTGPPIFHDTMKCWSCCRDRKAYDFETFQLITGCSVGRHSTISPAELLGKSPNAPTEAPSEPKPVLKSIESYNAANPNAVTAASAAVNTLSQRKSTRNEDGSARCQRKGCQKTFLVEDNSATACTYHKGQPVFHDAVKFWSCCPEKKCYDFDEFLAVPGCSTGFHDDGIIELGGST
jgi:CHORD